MNLVIHLLALLFAHDGAALAATAPEPIDPELGALHVAAARVAGARHGVDPDLLLSIAAHESHYQTRARTPEVGGLTSCGVMTPEPLVRCGEPDELLGYDAGAAHLRTWIDAARGDLRVALLGYAGGYRMISRCAEGAFIVHRGGRDVDLCSIPEVFLNRAAMIRRARGTDAVRPRHPRS